jgi:hypothetical protein
MATTQFVIADNVNTQLASAATTSATTLTLASSANLPTLSGGQVMPLTLNDAATGAIYEIVYVTAITGVTLTVTRAQEGTTAQNWNIGDFAFVAPTSGTVAMINGNPSNQFFVAPATASQHAMQLGQATGRLLNVQVFTSSGTYTQSSSLVTSVIVEVQGGGGGSAGSPATTSTQASVGGAGSNGAYAKSRFTSGFSGVAVTVGAGGVAGTVGGPGGNGGASSFGTLTTAGGGFGGNTGGPTTTSTIAGPTSIPTATGGNILQINGGYPAYSFCVATGIIFTIPSPGSPSQMGPSPGPNAAGSGFGVGGGGSGNAASAAASVGYAGTQGKVIVYEYA